MKALGTYASLLPSPYMEWICGYGWGYFETLLPLRNKQLEKQLMLPLRKHKHSITTVKKEVQTLAEKRLLRRPPKKDQRYLKFQRQRQNQESDRFPKPKAIDSRATFISETFLFWGCEEFIIFES